MKLTDINIRLKKLRRISKVVDRINCKDDVLFVPDEVTVEFINKYTVKTTGLGELDKKNKDLLRIIEVINPLNIEFRNTCILSPRTFVESVYPIPKHLTTQGIFITKMTNELRKIINNLSKKYKYDKQTYDKLWIGNKKINEIKNDSILIIMNRRVGGWDGSINRPVIELLGAGGHIPTVWDDSKNRFVSLGLKETLLMEAKEELGINLNLSDVTQLGGFFNSISNELVVLHSIYIEPSSFENIQRKAYGNFEENTNGLYIGEFDHIMEMYNNDATPFAGGEKAKSTNFPSQKELMERINSNFKDFR